MKRGQGRKRKCDAKGYEQYSEEKSRAHFLDSPCIIISTQPSFYAVIPSVQRQRKLWRRGITPTIPSGGRIGGII